MVNFTCFLVEGAWHDLGGELTGWPWKRQMEC
jgi:hypothetical protein